MQINKNYEQEIKLRDLFFHLCYRWRSILVTALIGAILLGAYQYWSIQKIHKEGKQTKEEKQYEIDLQNYQVSVKNARNNIRTYTKLIKEKNDYLDESVYMSLDSQNEWVAYKRFYIKMDQAVLDALPESVQEDPADYVGAVYTATLKSELNAAEMETLLGTGKKEHIDELVSIWSDTASNTVTVQVIGESEAKVTEQLEYFIDRLYTYSEPMAQKVGAHTLSLVNEDCLSRTDSGLSAKQEEINQQITDWQESLKGQRETLNDLEEEEEPTPPGNHIKKFAAIGFIAFGALLAAIYALRFIFGDKLITKADITERYIIPLYGELPQTEARRSGKGLDKLFEKAEYGTSMPDIDSTCDTIAALIRERHGGQRVLLTGTASQKKLEALGKSLRERVGEACDLRVAPSLLNNNTAIAEAGEADAVLLVAEKYVNTVAQIDRAAEMLTIGNAKVAGCVLV